MTSKRDNIKGSINRIEAVIKHGRIKPLRKKLKEQVLKPIKDKIPNPKVEGSCANARKTAHTFIANTKRNVSNEVRNDLLL